MKKQLFLLLFMLLPMVASADDSGSCGDNVTYSYVEATHTLTISGSGTMRNYSYIIYAPWYSYRSNIMNVIIEDGVTSIGYETFYDCSSLTSITIPNSVTSIGVCAFYKCSGLTSITIPNSVTSIGTSAFQYCSGLTSVTIPNSVTSIGSYAFENCSGLTSITIPNSVTSIGASAFQYCSGLTSVTIPNSVTSIGEMAFYGCRGLTSITIPNSVTSIGKNAFEHTGWYNNQPDGVVYAGKCAYKYKGVMPANTIIILNEGTTGIAGGAFDGCSGLTSITIPNSVKSIGDGAFLFCSGLTSVTIPNSVTSIGANAFACCSGLNYVTIGNSVTSIGREAFYGCRGLTSITIPNSVTSIGGNAFVNTGWYNNQPDGVVYAGKCAYEYKGVMPANTIIILNEGTTGIAGGAFSGCSGLTSITIPNSVKSIGDGAFSVCSGLTSITIPNSVKSIGDGAFSVCSGLTSVTIPNSVTSIGGRAFEGCSGLTSITVEQGNTTYDSRNNCNAIIETSSNRLITGCKNTTIPNNVTSIEEYAFYGCSGLTSVTIPNSVTSIGKRAFLGCTNLLTVNSEITEPFNCSGAFAEETQRKGVLYIPAGTKDLYTRFYGWREFLKIEEVAPSAVRIAQSQAEIKVVSDGVVISNAEPDTRCVVYQTDGKQVVNTVINEGTRKIALQKGQAYILTIDGRTLKFAL